MQSVKTAIVFSGATVNNFKQTASLIPEDAFVICADSGVLNCEKMNYKADIVVGDFDSYDYKAAKELSCTKNAEFIVLNPEKDDTDTEFCIDKLIGMGFNTVYIVGGIGSRLDHTLANVFLMEKCFKSGVRIMLVNENNVVHYLSNSSLELTKNNFKYVSLIPLENSIVTINGFKYPLDNDVLTRDSSRGISNELSCEKGTVKVLKGSVLVVESID